ncbi:MAG: hypothetical protein QNJ94_20430 [Alphaproteobacteria bacterium]|nr:hypothetical protein [Alphaproteobacteria bacterium]
MKSFADFVKTTVSGGFFVVLPIMLVWLILVETLDVLVALTSPIAELLPLESIGAETEANLVAIAVLLILCVVTGLAIRADIGVSTGRWIERKFLQPLPGYAIFKSLSRRFSGDKTEESFVPAVVSTPLGTRMLAFIVEEHDNGDLTVFVPAAPTPAMGMVHIVTKEQVRVLDAPMGAVAGCFWEFGTGTKALLAANPPQRQETQA